MMARGGLFWDEGTAEDKFFSRAECDALLDLAEGACVSLNAAQMEALRGS